MCHFHSDLTLKSKANKYRWNSEMVFWSKMKVVDWRRVRGGWLKKKKNKTACACPFNPHRAKKKGLSPLSVLLWSPSGCQSLRQRSLSSVQLCIWALTRATAGQSYANGNQMGRESPVDWQGDACVFGYFCALLPSSFLHFKAHTWKQPSLLATLFTNDLRQTYESCVTNI